MHLTVVTIRYAVSLCFVGLIESVMTLQACDEITETLPSSFRSNQECVAQGLANLLCGVFGAMGGDAMIGQSTINIMNGARGRLSGMTAGVFMMLFIVLLSPVIELVPIGTLTGVLFMVVINTFNWTTFTTLRKVWCGAVRPVGQSVGLSVGRSVARFPFPFPFSLLPFPCPFLSFLSFLSVPSSFRSRPQATLSRPLTTPQTIALARTTQ